MYSWLRADISAPPNYSSFQVKCLPPNFRQISEYYFWYVRKIHNQRPLQSLMILWGLDEKEATAEFPMQLYMRSFWQCKNTQYLVIVGLINRHGSKFSFTITLNRSNWTTTAIRLDAHRLSFYRTLINAFKNCDWKKAQTFETLTQLPQVIFL